VRAPDYSDLYFALTSAAENLGWSDSEKQNLENACSAVEISGNTEFHYSSDVPKDILDKQTTASSLTIDGNRPIDDIDVKVELYHQDISDLSIRLVSPSGKSVLLVDGDNMDTGHSNGYCGTLFDDEAKFGIHEGENPYIGCFRPAEPLDTFNDEDPGGEWVLEIYDNNVLRQGTLSSWCLRRR
jgi:subtilisin-like proprotein convertase family protein